MQYIGVIKRVVPFLITFAAGLFIASFFVTLTAPSFEGFRKDRSSRWSRCKEMKMEVNELRRENYRLNRELEALNKQRLGTLDIPTGKAKGATSGSGIGSGTGAGTAFTSDLDRMVPPPPPLTPVKEIKMKTVTVK